MRSLPRLAVLGALSALLAVPAGAMGANSAKVTLSPNKGGSLTVAAPTTFKMQVSTPDTPVDPSGSRRIRAIEANLPEQLLFNTTGFKMCNSTDFVATKSCPSATKLGSATVLADGGPDIGVITATTDLYFGTGFTVLARIQSQAPAVIDEAVIGSLRSSGVRGYGLQMYIPVPAVVAQPLPGLFPTVRSLNATVKPATRSVRVPGEKKKVKLPMAGLGICSGKLNFQVNIVYGDAAGANTTKIDGASTSAKCKK